MEEMKETETVEIAETKRTPDDLRGESLTDRVKVLSPTQMVLKRFFRSKLSVVGLVVLVAV